MEKVKVYFFSGTLPLIPDHNQQVPFNLELMIVMNKITASLCKVQSIPKMATLDSLLLS
jgi:hypothetical protein